MKKTLILSLLLIAVAWGGLAIYKKTRPTLSTNDCINNKAALEKKLRAAGDEDLDVFYSPMAKLCMYYRIYTHNLEGRTYKEYDIASYPDENALAKIGNAHYWGLSCDISSEPKKLKTPCELAKAKMDDVVSILKGEKTISDNYIVNFQEINAVKDGRSIKILKQSDSQTDFYAGQPDCGVKILSGQPLVVENNPPHISCQTTNKDLENCWEKNTLVVNNLVTADDVLNNRVQFSTSNLALRCNTEYSNIYNVIKKCYQGQSVIYECKGSSVPLLL